MSNEFSKPYSKVTIIIETGDKTTTLRIPRAKYAGYSTSEYMPLSMHLELNLTAEFDSVSGHIMSEEKSTTPKEQLE